MSSSGHGDSKSPQKHSMQDYEIQNLLVSLQRQNQHELYQKVKNLVHELKTKQAIKEENSIKINILKKKLNDEPKILENQKNKLVEMVRKSNQAKIDQLKNQLEETQRMIEQISFDEENGRAINNLLIVENQKKQKLQESLVQLLNDTMAEKARMQINVNKTKMETNSCNEAKAIKAAEFEKYQNIHDLKVQKLLEETNTTKKKIKDTKADIVEMSANVETSHAGSCELQKTCQSMDTNNHTAKIQLSEHQRRILELKRQKSFSDKQILEKRDVRNFELKNELNLLNKTFKAVSQDYLKRIGIAKDTLKDCQESLVGNEIENKNLIDLKAEWERSLTTKRSELDEVVNFMSGVRETTENIRIQLDKKRRAIMRVRNENDSIGAELNRALTTHRQEVLMFDQLTEDLVNEVDISTKIKLDLEKDFKKLQDTIGQTKKQANKNFDAFDRRNRASCLFTKNNNKFLHDTEDTLHEIEEDFDQTAIRFRKRRNAVVHDTDVNNKLIEDFSEKITVLKEDIITYEEEDKTLVEPYTILKKEHFNEEFKYNKLKNNVLDLNSQIRKCNQTIQDNNQEIEDMQGPRKKFQEKLEQERKDLRNSTENDRIVTYRVERQIYEIERKLEEYKNRSEEILVNCEKLMDFTIYQGNLVKIINSAKNDKDLLNEEFSNKIKALNEARNETFSKIYNCGDTGMKRLSKFNKQLEKRFEQLVVIEDEIEDSCEKIKF